MKPAITCVQAHMPLSSSLLYQSALVDEINWEKSPGPAQFGLNYVTVEFLLQEIQQRQDNFRGQIVLRFSSGVDKCCRELLNFKSSSTRPCLAPNV